MTSLPLPYGEHLEIIAGNVVHWRPCGECREGTAYVRIDVDVERGYPCVEPGCFKGEIPDGACGCDACCAEMDRLSVERGDEALTSSRLRALLNEETY